MKKYALNETFREYWFTYLKNVMKRTQLLGYRDAKTKAVKKGESAGDILLLT
jgi:hypothetical protein